MPIRLATAADLPVINEIYNYYVEHSTATYQTEPSTMGERAAWFAVHGPSHPVTVFELDDGAIVGWGSLSRFHPRAAYGKTVENSVYIRHDCQRRGYGRALMVDLLERARALGHHTVVALISGDQGASLRLHEALGFAEAGRLREVGFKFDGWLDVVYLQRMT